MRPRNTQTLRTLLPMLLEAYPQITRERIVGHSDVAPGPQDRSGTVVRLVAGCAELRIVRRFP